MSLVVNFRIFEYLSSKDMKDEGPNCIGLFEHDDMTP